MNARDLIVAEAEDLVAYHLREQEFDPRHRDRTPAEMASVISRLLDIVRNPPQEPR